MATPRPARTPEASDRDRRMVSQLAGRRRARQERPSAAAQVTWRHVMRYARWNQCAHLGRRLLGMPVWRAADFSASLSAPDVARLANLARTIRGADYPPAILLHGVLPRSGTNYLANAIALHPDVAAFPRQIWEFPLLHVAPGAEALQSEFAAMFPANEALLGKHEFLAYLASGWLAALQAEVGARRILMKSPHVQHIGLFPAIFPRDKLVLCLRDGRDVVASTMKTFGRHLLRKSFRQIVTEWKLATDAALEFTEGSPKHHPNAVVVRYEDGVRAPQQLMQDLLVRLELDTASFPFDRLDHLPVIGSSTSDAEGASRWQPVTRDASFNPIGRWRDWPRRRMKEFMDIAGDTLVRAGYA
jgi:protein-tyrosine sulfotransferase